MRHPLRLLRVVLVVAFVALVALAGWVCDDAWITFRSVKQAWSGAGLVWNSGWRVQVSSHPAWLAVLLVLQPVTGHPWLSAMLASLLAAPITAWLVVGQTARRAGTVAVAGAVLVSSKALVEFGTSGLESPLSLLGLAWLGASVASGRATAAALAAGLVVVARPDHVVLVAPWVGWHVWTSRRVSDGMAAVGPAALWLVASVVYFGVPWPNPAVAKLGDAVPLAVRLAMGRDYLLDSVARDPVLLPVTAVAAAVALTRGTAAARALAAGALLHVVYVVAVGGDFMSGRFLVAPALLAGVAALPVLDARPRRGLLPAAAVVVLVGLLNPHGVVRQGPDPARPDGGAPPVADERTFAASAGGLVAWARGDVTLWAGGGPATPPVQVVEGAGGAGYGAPRFVHVVDVYGLTDPLLARLPVRVDVARAGHVRRPVPAGYVETLTDGRDHFVDRDIATCFARVRSVAQDPLLAPVRWVAIARLTIVGCDDLWRGRTLDADGRWRP